MGGLKDNFFQKQIRGQFRVAREIFLAGSKAGLYPHDQIYTEDTKNMALGGFPFLSFNESGGFTSCGNKCFHQPTSAQNFGEGENKQEGVKFCDHGRWQKMPAPCM